jgi:long-chain acyl-CoA synthetase
MALQDDIITGGHDYASSPALLFEGRTWSYGELDAVTDSMAANLMAHGLRRGDRVALLFANGPEIVFSYYACFKAGLIAVPINTRMKGPEQAYVLRHSGARALLGQKDLLQVPEPERAELESLEMCFLTGLTTPSGDVQPFETLLTAVPTPDLPAIDAGDIAAVFYTSGTTAKPKGVTHTHASLECLAASCIECWGRDDLSIYAMVPPLCHMGAFGTMLSTFRAGGALLTIPGFNPMALLQAVQTYRVTAFWLVPAMYAALTQVPDAASHDLSSLRLCQSGGDSMPEPIRERFRTMFGPEIVEVCGMTELIYSSNAPGEGNRPGSIGRPLPGVSMRLIDDAGADTTRGEIGEIVVRSDAMMTGYWQDPEATASAVREGWLYTGDLAWEDADGYYWFAGRKKDIIIRGGSNIAPAEVEEALCTHPAVHMAGVVGVSDPVHGQAVWAFVTLKPGTMADEAEIKSHVRERVADYKTPETIRIVPTLPIGLTGKIHRATLREWAAAGA